MACRAKLSSEDLCRGVVRGGTHSHAIQFSSTVGTLRKKCRKTFGLKLMHQALSVRSACEAAQLNHPPRDRRRLRGRIRLGAAHDGTRMSLGWRRRLRWRLGRRLRLRRWHRLRRIRRSCRGRGGDRGRCGACGTHRVHA
jgi:hypothetical protein